ncbi:hypothetical protein RF11_01840 [Thelohanellus kitauei]|uniref:Uncharacterized protein n=1 Tax=Thelohanellus kitauei TaxID=669202 RepID=A0A0C2ICP2_THEKT|nr:hypothetical protein RF11_01840 [Thelohanellus kitauei]
MTIIKEMCNAIVGVLSDFFRSIRSWFAGAPNEGYQVIDSSTISSEERSRNFAGTSQVKSAPIGQETLPREFIHEPSKHQQTQMKKFDEEQVIYRPDASAKHQHLQNMTQVSEGPELLFETRSMGSDDKTPGPEYKAPGLDVRVPIATPYETSITPQSETQPEVPAPVSSPRKVSPVEDQTTSQSFGDDVSKINFLKSESVSEQIQEKASDKTVDDTMVPQSITQVLTKTPEVSLSEVNSKF